MKALKEVRRMLVVSYLDVSVAMAFVLAGGYFCADRCLASFVQRRIRPNQPNVWTDTPIGAIASIPAHVAWGIADLVQTNLEIISMLPPVVALGITRLTLGDCSVEYVDPDDEDDDDDDDEVGVPPVDGLINMTDEELFGELEYEDEGAEAEDEGAEAEAEDTEDDEDDHAPPADHIRRRLPVLRAQSAATHE